MTRRPRVVVLRALGLGDFLTGVPALRAIRRAFPAARITLAAPSAFAPWVHRHCLADEVAHTEGLAPLPPTLAAPEVAVDLHGRGPGSQPLLLALDPGRLIAFSHPDLPATAGLPTWRPGEHEVRRWCRLLEESGIPTDPDDLALDPPPVAAPGWLAGGTLLHVGAASEARRWPADRFAAVARHERAAGRVVALSGGPADVARAEAVAAAAGLPAERVLAGRTDLDGLAAAVASAGRVVSGDTGCAHLATALSTPSVVLMGPIPPSEWGPPPDRPLHVALWTGRRGDPHGAVPDPGLLEIDVGRVIDALETLPARGAG